MPKDLTLPLREAIVQHLRADAGMIALVDGRVYGELPPSDAVWPFVRYGWDTNLPFSAQCIDGGRVDVTMHAFTQEKDTDLVKRINAGLVDALHDAALTFDEAGAVIDLSFVSSQTLPEGPDGQHGIVRFTALVGAQGD